MFPLNTAISWGLKRSKHIMFRLTQLGNCRYGYGSNMIKPFNCHFLKWSIQKTLSGGDSRGRGTGTSGDCKESHSWWWDDMGWPENAPFMPCDLTMAPFGCQEQGPYSHIPTFFCFCLSRLDWLKGKSAGSQMEKKSLVSWVYCKTALKSSDSPTSKSLRAGGPVASCRESPGRRWSPGGAPGQIDQSRANVHTQESPRRVVNLPVVGTSPFFLLEPQTRGPAHFFHFCWNHPIWSPNNSK